MARRTNAATPETSETPTPGGMEGGAPGFIPEASQTIHHPGAAVANAAAMTGAPDPAKEVGKVSRYRVMAGGSNRDGSWPILYGNIRTQLVPGKVLDTGSYDVDYLVRQGVKLEPMGEF